MAWVSLPTFDLDYKEYLAFKNFLNDLSKARKKKIIVFDLRKNQGGNSEYGTRIIETIFGKKYVQNKIKIANKNEFVDWRVSRDNLIHLNNLYKRYKSAEIKAITDGMQMNLEKGLPYYRESHDYSKENIRLIKKPNQNYPLVYVITDHVNVSAALDFIDTLKIIDINLTFLGQITKADRLYMEVRTVALPSKLGSFSFPIKVYCNRMRKDNETYVPDIICDICNTKELQNLMVGLAKRRYK